MSTFKDSLNQALAAAGSEKTAIQHSANIVGLGALVTTPKK